MGQMSHLFPWCTLGFLMLGLLNVPLPSGSVMARPLSEEARQKALSAAQTVIAEHGIAGFTLDAVAHKSGVAKSTIYRHWEDRNDLLFSAIGCMVQPFPTPNTGSLAGDLRAFMCVVLPIISDPVMRRTMTGVLAAATDDPELARVHQQMMEQRMAPITTILDLAKGRGEVARDLDTELALALIEGPFFVKLVVKNQPLDDATLDEMIDLIVKALTT